MIGADYMTMNNEFYHIISESINSRIEEEGDQFIVRDAALDSARQIEQLNQMIEQGVDALVIAPVDWQSLTNVLDKARERGILVVIVDTDVNDPRYVDSTIASDNYEAGQVLGEYYLTQIQKSNLVLLTHEAAKSARDRVQGFLDVVQQNPNIKVVSRLDCEGQLEIAMPKMKDLIQSGTQFDTVFCLNDLAAVGAVAALDENNLTDKVQVYGIDASPDSKTLVNEGLIKATIAQFPIEIGKKTADVLYDLFDDRPVQTDIRIPVELITKDNIGNFNLDRWQ